MADYPATVAPGSSGPGYKGEFPEACGKVEVTMNGAEAPAIVTPLSGGGWRVKILPADIACPGSGDGSIVVKDECDPPHVWTTTITPC